MENKFRFYNTLTRQIEFSGSSFLRSDCSASRFCFLSQYSSLHPSGCGLLQRTETCGTEKVASCHRS